MKSKKRNLFIAQVLLLVLIVNLILSWMPGTQVKVSAEDTSNVETIIIEDEDFCSKLKNVLTNNSNSGALVSFNEKNMTINYDKILYLDILSKINMTEDNAAILEKLIQKSSNLTRLALKNIDLSEFDFSSLSNKNTLTSLYLMSCHLDSVPKITLPNLEVMYLTNNNFLEEGACANLNNSNFPKLKNLYLDWCFISDISFFENMGTNLTVLSLARNKLTDASIDSFKQSEESEFGNRG